MIAYQHDVAARVSRWEAHAEWANENRDQFRLAMEEWTTDPEKAARLASEGDSASKAVELAAIAANPPDARRVREGVPSEHAVELVAPQRTLRELYEDARDQIRGWPIVIFATGTAMDALGKPGDASDDGQSAITTGSLGATVETSVSRCTTPPGRRANRADNPPFHTR